ncbi:hypothetical protein IV498_16340 [Paenarthrobacter sp. Z7-10]|uniref:hypothetical protein n=1 Tax=Paenarthrobacter sp. Z7-10 TaxID=2787635 RepID=UPI0022A934B0|nr:hypothetical protein [Paenarthrobacter sp. Z7-10]MCZ2404703.1 hypothetical protein [Paenarthrobacter sp. Z7-10]
MSWNWAYINQAVDDIVIVVGIAILIVRQFIWRSAEISRMLRMPTLVIAAGIVYLPFELWGGISWRTADWLVVAELGLVAFTGAAMGYVTHFRSAGGQLQYRLTGTGILLWGLFIVIRIANFALAGALGANLADATGLILLSFGVNRLAAILVVRRRASALRGEERAPADR